MSPGRRPGPARRERLVGARCVLEALRARRRTLHRLRVRAGVSRQEILDARAAADEAGVAVAEVEADVLPDRASGAPTQGLELEAGPLPELTLKDLVETPGRPRTLVALDGVEDPQNLGAIARVAEAAGVQGLVLTRRHAPPLSPAVSRASAGAIEWLPVARVPNLSRALKDLKTEGFWIFGTIPEEGDDLFGLPDRLVGGDRVVVLGAEAHGLREGTLRVVDHRVRIPQAGRVGSLNVAAAAAVLLFELARRSRVATSP